MPSGRPILAPVLASGPPAEPLGAPGAVFGADELVDVTGGVAPDDGAPAVAELLALALGSAFASAAGLSAGSTLASELGSAVASAVGSALGFALASALGLADGSVVGAAGGLASRS